MKTTYHTYWSDPAGNIRRMNGDQEVIAVTTDQCTEQELYRLSEIFTLEPWQRRFVQCERSLQRGHAIFPCQLRKDHAGNNHIDAEGNVFN